MANNPPEIIVVRRASDEDDGHHGGVWKIAFADFMTTLMALFLVLWLIKATNDETKTSIANYFNPISLSEPLPLRKGVNDPQPASNDPNAGSKAGEPGGTADMRDKGTPLPPGSVPRERELFQDPYSVLAKLAAEVEPGKPQSAAIGDLGAAGRRGGDAARDPFDPLYWEVDVLAPARAERTAPDGITPPPRQARPDARGAEAAGREGEAKPAGPTPVDARPPADRDGEVRAEGPPVNGPSQASGQGVASAAALKAEIAKIFPPPAPGTSGPRVEVQGTPEGLLINVTDDLNFSMFAVGSAEPRPETVRAMERLAKALAARPGRIVVRGHTDSRPFRSEVYDNWRLSTARAHMASYMLTRAGIDEARIWRVEGAADRMPRNAADPKAPENRRIEILLQGSPG
ncbi:MotB family protein [Methylobacterium radiotolerans]|uniref:OmpA/MotB domain protein n=3 Tax=Methylobacteriaceae TaxID=119045 RepID=B1M6L4_METRJ|nr:MotB family protein [Methylobacterium radiotolerans]ACB23674.1 OmpA/MotB domain protein [Methylobacterium radiotolerans JCM 2831]KTS12329.1 hypothetical protein SB3_01740 [Methylobacterium radiotolerans]KTS44232.1 hypothetical protein SB2_25285 [Methylobacterium radiotolerans]ONF49973.1 hypothetical protein RSM1_06635 [Methylobacterium radiotolerans]GEM97746.1 flagellar motor protein MotB [Methylobacterium radiotolerans]